MEDSKMASAKVETKRKGCNVPEYNERMAKYVTCLGELSGRLAAYDAGMKQIMMQKTQHVRIGLADLMSFQPFGLPENRMATGYQ